MRDFNCGLDLSVGVESVDRVTRADRVESENVFEWTDRVDTLAGVSGEEELGEDEAPEARERLGGTPELPSFRGRLLSDDAGGEPKQAERQKLAGLNETEACRDQRQRDHDRSTWLGPNVKDR